MELVRIRSTKLRAGIRKPLAAAIGSFDGLHKGHREVLRAVTASARAKGFQSALITFSPHPSVALGKIEKLPLITTLHQRFSILESLGIDYLIIISFTKELGELSWDSFCNLYLHHLIPVRHLVIGSDARIGKGALGTAPLIKEHLESNGCSVEISPFVSVEGVKIASRTIRQALIDGDVVAAKELLARYYTLDGRVTHGDGKGKGIGFATANLYIPNQVIPKDGVYCGYAEVDDSEYEAVCNIGNRPTVGGTSRQIEVHIISAPIGDLYGKKLSFSFAARLRDEMKFSSVSELSSQITRDIFRSQEILKRRE